MLTFTSKFLFGVLIDFILGLLLNGLNSKDEVTTHNNNKTVGDETIYSPEIEKLWNDLIRLYNKKTELYSKFLFIEMTSEIYKLLDKQKAIAAATIRNFYLRRTNPREITRETIQRQIDEEKKEIVNHEDDEIIDGSDNIINNSDSKEE